MTDDTLDFKEFLKQIVDTCYPDEDIAFTFAADDIIQILSESKDPKKEIVRNSGDFNLLEETKNVINLINLAVGTYKTVTELRKQSKEQTALKLTVESLSERWTDNLMAAGINATDARKITAQFTSDALTLIKK